MNIGDKSQCKPIGFRPVFPDDVLIRTRGGEKFKTAEDFPFKTKVLNTKLKLEKWETAYWEVPKGYESNGATVPLLNIILFFTFLNLLTDFFTLELFSSVVIIIAFLIKMSEAAWRAGLGHDFWWGEQYLIIDVLDDTTGEIVRNIGITEVNFADGTKFMLEKMNSWFENNVLIYSTGAILFVTRILKGKK